MSVVEGNFSDISLNKKSLQLAHFYSKKQNLD